MSVEWMNAWMHNGPPISQATPAPFPTLKCWCFPGHSLHSLLPLTLRGTIHRAAPVTSSSTVSNLPPSDTKPTSDGLLISSLRAHSISTPKLPETQLFPPLPTCPVEDITTQPVGHLWPWGVLHPQLTPRQQVPFILLPQLLRPSSCLPGHCPGSGLVTSPVDTSLTSHLLFLPQVSRSHPSLTPLGV